VKPISVGQGDSANIDSVAAPGQMREVGLELQLLGQVVGEKPKSLARAGCMLDDH
jgi:hypothetical protein